jgi:iron(III) transport system substrate-binding protein
VRSIETVCKAGEAEGALTYWGSYTPETWEKLMAPFRARWPGIQLTLLPQNPTEVVQRILTESSAGRQIAADVVGSNPVLGQQIVDRGLVAKDIDWTSLGVKAELVRPDGPIRHFRALYGLGYNTDLVKPEELPKTWDDLIDPKWGNGSLIVSPAVFPFHVLALDWGKDRTIEYVKRLMATLKPTVIQGTTAGIVNMASGATKMYVAARNVEIQENEAKGAPVGIHYLDPIAGSDNFFYVLNTAQHPNAAQCLVAWQESPEGLQAQYDTEFKRNDTVPADVPAGTRVLTINTPADLELTNEVLKELTPVITGK